MIRGAGDAAHRKAYIRRRRAARVRSPPGPLLLLGLVEIGIGIYLVLAPIVGFPYELRLPQDARPGEASLMALAILTGVLSACLGVAVLYGAPLAWWILLGLAVEDLVSRALLSASLIGLHLPLSLLSLYVLARADTRAHVGVDVAHRRRVVATDAEVSSEA